MIRFSCPRCKAALKAPEDKAGVAIACPKCGQRLQIPSAGQAASSRLPSPERKMSRPAQRQAARGKAGRGTWIGLPVALLLLGGAGALAYVLGFGKPTDKPAVAVVTPSSTPKGKEPPAPAAAPTTAKAPPTTTPGAGGGTTTVKEPPPKTSPEASEKPKPTDKTNPEGNEKAKPPDGPPVDFDGKTLEAINAQRKTAGLQPVVLDPLLCRGCAAHARYLADNAANPAVQGPGAFTEDPQLPGHSEEGKQAAGVAAVEYGEPLGLVNDWFARFSRRPLLLDPGLQKIGVGYAATGPGKGVSVLDLTRGKATVQDWVVAYPVDKQTNVPLAFPGVESPDPLPQSKDKIAGYPITVTFSPGREVRNVKASCKDAAGQEVAVWLSTPEKPANASYPTYQNNTVCMMAKEPLKPSTAYTAQVAAEVNGQTWQSTWSFTTVKGEEGGEELARKAVDRINAYRKAAGAAPVTLDAALSAGCTAHARYLARNLNPPVRPNLDWSDEAADLPGSSAEGRKAAKRSISCVGMAPVAAVDWCVTSYLNRSVVLDAALRTVSLGFATDRSGGWVTVLDYSSGRRGASAPVVLFPGNQQKDVPLVYPISEAMSPVPEKKVGEVGYAITAGFPFGAKVTKATAKLTDGTGAEVEGWLSSPEKPAIASWPQNTICLIPKAALKPGTTYAVAMAAEVGGKPWKHAWSFTTIQKAEPTPEEVQAQLLERVNAYRTSAGLAPVVLDADLSKGCAAHARYLVLNAQSPAVQGLGMHGENPASPGYTEEGSRAAPASVITDRPEPLEAVDGCMSTLYHRLPFLNPDLKRVGIGCAKQPGGNWKCVLDVTSGKGVEWTVLYPADGQKGVPLQSAKDAMLGGVAPEIVSGKVGYPITVQFAPAMRVDNFRVEVKDDADKAIAFWLVSPKNAPAREALNAVGVLAQEPLKPDVTYKVTVRATVNGKEWTRTWTFTTGPGKA